MTKIDPEITYGEAVSRILAKLLDDLVSSQSGARQAVDDECLHKFRIAVRRTRVVIAQYKDIMPPAAVDYFSDGLRWLGRLTRQLRDADTQLLALAHYREWLPEDLIAAVQPFEEYLQRVRSREQNKFISEMDGGQYDQFITYWRRFLAEGYGNWNERAREPYLDGAGARIWRRYRNVKRAGRKISPVETAPAACLHDLRKKTKKLRYSIEFLELVIPRCKSAKTLRRLRQLQNILGEHQDFEVHANVLMQFSRRFAQSEVASAQTSLALGVLIGRLNASQAETRVKFGDCFKKFSGKKTKRDFYELCYQPTEEAAEII